MNNVNSSLSRLRERVRVRVFGSRQTLIRPSGTFSRKREKELRLEII